MINFFRNIFSKKSSTSNAPIDEYVHIEYSKKSTDQIIEAWRYTDLKLNDPATEDLIQETQHKINYNFPEDFLRFYRQVNGFKDWDIIGNMFSIWTLERIIEEYEISDDKNFIPFCDFCIDCHRIGYLKDQSGIYKDYDQTSKITDTFDETIKLIIKDSKLLY